MNRTQIRQTVYATRPPRSHSLVIALFLFFSAVVVGVGFWIVW